MKKVKVMVVVANDELYGISYDTQENILRWWCDTQYRDELRSNCVDSDGHVNDELVQKYINSDFWEESWDWFDAGDIMNDELNLVLNRGLEENVEDLDEKFVELFGCYPYIRAEREFETGGGK